jgi:hypothetical protein
MEIERQFDRLKDCIKCQRYIDEKEVKLKKIVVGPDTYRRYDILNDPKVKYERICTDCFHKK